MRLVFEKNNLNKDIAYYVIKSEDAMEFGKLKYKIEQKLIGSSLSEDFFKLFQLLKPKISNDEFVEYYREISSDSLDIIEYLRQDKSTYFTEIIVNFNNSEKFRPISIDSIVSETFMEAKKYIKDYKIISKFKLVSFIYKYLQNYKVIHPELANRVELTHYRLTVITGLIILKLSPELVKGFNEYTFDYNKTTPDDFNRKFKDDTKKIVLDCFYNLK